ncbi:MAG TPA: ATP-dependent helicase [Vicinamibacterales bacterium]|nr:ATP-dependent helicase [Vicinamibacterales bacterium]
MAIDAVSRNLLVLAGPGTGKTRLLTNLAAYHVRSTPRASSRVLCLTFSVEAAQQMRTRLRSRELEVRARDRLHAVNFHQFGAELLRAYGDLIGRARQTQVLGRHETEELVGELIHELGIPAVSPYAMANNVSAVRNERSARDVPAQTLRRFLAAYERRKRELALYDYDDLIIGAVELLRAQPRLASILQTAYRHVLVDELQDTSRQQLELIALVTGEGRSSLFGVADNDQMVYSWRDARPENLTEFETRFGATRRPLLGNYRCPRHIVAAANAIIAPVAGSDGGPRAYSRVTGRDGQLLVARANSEYDAPELVADVVAAELEHGVQPERIAILHAIRRGVFEPIVTALEQRGFPVVQIGSDIPGSSMLARVIQAAIASQLDSHDTRARARLARLIGAAVLDEEEGRKIIDSLSRAQSIDQTLDQSAAVLGIDANGSEAMHVRRVCLLAAREMGGATATMLTRLRLEWPRLDARLRREAESVKVMTTFAAKGQEFQTVIFPAFTLTMTPYVHRNARTDEAWWAEERRKLYVAITRATHRVVFVHWGAPSTFLSEIPADILSQWQPAIQHEP